MSDGRPAQDLDSGWRRMTPVLEHWDRAAPEAVVGERASGHAQRLGQRGKGC